MIMKKVITIVLIVLFIWAICSTATNAKTIQGGVQETVLESRTSNNNLDSQIANDNYLMNEKAQQGQCASNSLYGKTAALTGRASHTANVYGVFGSPINCRTGQLLGLYPSSHVQESGMVPGDYIIEINGRHYTWPVMLTECAGEPGTPIYITYLHHGQVYQTTVIRVDARDVQKEEWRNSVNPNYYSQLAHMESY
jgi:hypothetical protein